MSVAAQTLYERENPFHQAGPGHKLDLSDCTFEQISEREVHVGGSRFIGTDDYWVKLEGARVAGYRSICIAGIRCPSMIGCIDDLLADAKAQALRYFNSPQLKIEFHVYGRDGVMREPEPQPAQLGKEIGLLMEAVDHTQEAAHAVTHFLSGTLLHCSFPGQFNTAGNLAFPYSHSEIDAEIGRAH